MKRVALHIAFWLLYVIQDAVLVFTWIGPSLGKMSDQKLFGISLAVTVIVLIPKLLFTYFIFYRSIPRILSSSTGIFPVVVEILIALAICLIIYMSLGKYYVNPVFYHNAFKDNPLFDIKRILMALMDTGFVAGISVTIKFIRIQLAAKEREKNLVREKLGAELKFLRNQTNPHFLMNTLNNIYALARRKSDDTAEVVMKLSELLRFMLYESDSHFIPLSSEIKVLEDYLELEKMRYNKRLTVTFNRQIDGGSYEITPLLLLPFVENAFKHGVSETRFASFIHIDMKVQGGRLTFNIENSKDTDTSQVITNNIGMNNVKRQLELIYKDYQLDVQNGDTIYKVTLIINLNNHAAI
jgi:two-component system, LytTR family, sensor kinase